ncbi:uncharacterized protein A4U43_C01F34360 [Asparagus officinalis]|uniref:Cytosolic Fe-S cluster assembly factor NBP35 n=1 Tax=Asparagus officinalis TaxID=4686 RepID=A0A5P1FUL2_ASPOF|nr:uncharacterized protein A4U43_C01F34360 [Asparagus officinalis]
MEYQVGLLDVDLCGPSIPKMLGLEGQDIHQGNLGWSPIYLDSNLGIMSIGFMLPNPDDAVIWQGPRKNALFKRFLKDVDWGEIDYIVIDTPPGTSDEHISAVQYVQTTGINGVIIVTTPQQVSLIDVRKERSFCKTVGLRVLGVVENMSGLRQSVSDFTEVFDSSKGGAEEICEEMGVPFLGKVPMDPKLCKSADEDRSCFLDQQSAAGAARALKRIIEKVVTEE